MEGSRLKYITMLFGNVIAMLSKVTIQIGFQCGIESILLLQHI